MTPIAHPFARIAALGAVSAVIALAACRSVTPPAAVRTLNIAHRGGGGLAPEETLVAYRNALDHGADILEMDLHATADGVVVLCHDATVDRTTNGTGAIREKTFAEVRGLDAGFRFSPDRGVTFPHRGKGVVIPTLREVLAAFPGARFLAEIKQAQPSVVDPVLAVLRELAALDRVTLTSAHGREIARLRAAEPQVRTGMSPLEVVGFLSLGPSQAATFAPRSRELMVPAQLAGAELMKRARALGLRVTVWTVNAVDDLRRLVELGVDGIITDYPDRLRNVLRATVRDAPLSVGPARLLGS